MGDSEIIRDEAVRRVREVFNIFDSDGTDTCEAKEIGTLIRALGFNPNEIQVRAMLSQMMVRVMMENEITRDSEERIVQAFKTIAKGKHSINMEELAVYLTTMGDKFTQEELEEFKSASMDPDKGEILYEDYASVLASDNKVGIIRTYKTERESQTCA